MTWSAGSWFSSVATAGVASAIVACGPSVHPAPEPLARCFPADSTPVRLLDTLAIASDQRPEDPAPDPARAFWRAIVAPPLVWFDCLGRPVPSLAVRWTRDSSGAIWDLTLAPGTVDANLVGDRWRAARVWDGLAKIDAVLPNQLRLSLVEPADTLPAELADPALGIDGLSAPPLVRWVAAPPDARDLLDPASPDRVDLLFTRDARVITFASGRPEWLVVPLPFDRLYTLVGPTPGAGEPGSSLLDAVRVDARVAQIPAWWSGPQCRPSARRGPTASGAELLYPAGDPTAKALAERLVALSARPAAPQWLSTRLGAAANRLRAVPADSTRLRQSVESPGGSWAVLGETVRRPLGCSQWTWSARAGSRMPLLETRAHLIVRRGTRPLAIDRDGIVRLVRARRP